MKHTKYPSLFPLTPRHAFLDLKATGKSYKGKYIICQIKTEDSDHFRIELGITVTKRNGNAVARNRIKRVLRAIFLKYLDNHFSDIIQNKIIKLNLIPRFGLKHATFDAISIDLEKLVKPCL